MKVIALGLFASLVAAGCSTTVAYSPLSSPPRRLSARPPASVAVFETPPERPYVAVGIIETQPETVYSEYRLTPKMLARMRDEAAAQGCDAMVMMAPTPIAAGNPIGESEPATSYRATCVVFTGATASR